MTAAAGLAIAIALAALPERAERRYRVEIGGEPVGHATLAVSCAQEGCRASWATALRAPAAAGGATLERRIELEVAPSGEARSTRVRIRDGRGEREVEAGAGPAPASLAELLLSDLAPGGHRCLQVRDEASGRSGQACGRREAGWLEVEVLGVVERVRGSAGELPEEVLLPEQRVRYVADPEARLPERAPRLYGVRVSAAPGLAPERAARFCGLPAEPISTAPPSDLPAFPDGESCRERATRFLAALRAQGREGRHVVGVAWDGEGFVWHEWAEVRTGAAWVAVDPSFGQAPARGPRFVVARFAPGDREGEDEAGRRVLSCWGAARVER